MRNKMPDSFQNPIGGGKPHDPYKDYRVEEIQKEMGEKKREGSPPEKPFLAAFILHAFKKFFELFEEKSGEKPMAYTETDVRGQLVEMRDLLESLKMEDHSQDASFLQKLSQVWMFLLEAVMQFSRRSNFAVQMQALIESLQEYPGGDGHSFGYYLTECAGQKWMPFPYMEIVRGLWADYQENLEASRLSGWCRDLNEMINSLGSD